MSERIPVVEKILSANDRLAAENREIFDRAGIFAINFMASPGAGKTSLIERTVQGLLAYPSPIRLAVIDGDIATSLGPTAPQQSGRSRSRSIRVGSATWMLSYFMRRYLSSI
jgi:hydrogenase nickel incorporation protein HypB